MLRIYYRNELIQNLQLLNERNYIVNVHRLRIKDQISLFNTKDGEFIYQIEKIDRDHVYCTKISAIKSLEKFQRISVAIPMIKPARLEFAIEKMIELGVAKIFLILTERTIKREPDFKRLSKKVCSALEQSLRVHLPELIGPITLEDFLEGITNPEKLIVGSVDGVKASSIVKINEATLLIGPEGGFSDREKNMLEKYRKISIVPDSILRTETAAIAGLTALKQLKQLSK